MGSPLWLPPLNSHENYATIVSVSQSDEPMINQECPETNFLIRVYVDVTFYSHSKQIPLEGLSVWDEFLASYCSMINSSEEQVKKFISGILCYMHIPFQLDHILFKERHVNRARKTLRRSYSSLPEDTDSWVVKLQEFLQVMTKESHNIGHNVLPFNLMINKNIWISSDEFETWLSWFHEKERVDPSFRRAYLDAVSRPRTIQELLEAENLKFKGVQKSSLASLQDASLSDETKSQCMVCLEEFSPGCEACRLPCSHIFHKSCIHKWLQESNMCPLCRSTLPSDQCEL